jgi:hypothetical protein
MQYQYPDGTTAFAINQAYIRGDIGPQGVKGDTGSIDNAVSSFNGKTGPIGFTAGTNISIIYSGITYTISSSGGTVTGVDEARTWFL